MADRYERAEDMALARRLDELEAEIERLRGEIEQRRKVDEILHRLHAQRARKLARAEDDARRLREAVRPLVELVERDWSDDEPDEVMVRIPLGSLRRLRLCVQSPHGHRDEQQGRYVGS